MTTASARETFAARTADLAARVRAVKLTPAQDRDLRLIAAGKGQNVTRPMTLKLRAAGVLTIPPLTVEHLANPGSWPGVRLSELGTAYVRRAA